MKAKSIKTLSCFIDETGDFGAFDSHCPFYIVTAVLHDQSTSIEKEINGLEHYLTNLGYQHHTIHSGPLIRREFDYKDLSMEERKKLFNILFNFSRKLPIYFFCATVKKNKNQNSEDLYLLLTKEIKSKIQKSPSYWNSFDKIIIYYDNGQKALKRILNKTFQNMFSNVEVRKIHPTDYRLFQVADLICTLKLILSKIEIGLFSKTEDTFFHGSHEFKKEYWRKIKNKEM